jgi:hypothetical protein
VRIPSQSVNGLGQSSSPLVTVATGSWTDWIVVGGIFFLMAYYMTGKKGWKRPTE